MNVKKTMSYNKYSVKSKPKLNLTQTSITKSALSDRNSPRTKEGAKKCASAGTTSSNPSSDQQKERLLTEINIEEITKDNTNDEINYSCENEPKTDSQTLSEVNKTITNASQYFGPNEVIVERLTTDLIKNIEELDESSKMCKRLFNAPSSHHVDVKQNAQFLLDEVTFVSTKDANNTSDVKKQIESKKSQVIDKRLTTHLDEDDKKSNSKKSNKEPTTTKEVKNDNKSERIKNCDQGDTEPEDFKENGTQVKFTKSGAKAVMQKCLSQGLKQIIPSTPKRKKKSVPQDTQSIILRLLSSFRRSFLRDDDSKKYFLKFMDWKRYHRLNVIYSFLDDLEREYPAICTVSSIGKSVEGRDIKMIKISNSDANNSAVWLDGSIHSREWISAAVVTYIADTIVRNFETQPSSVTNKDWHIVPVVNPDGYEYSHTHDRMWRKNCCKIAGERIGVDLNRNFSYGWGYHGDQGSSDEPRSVFYRGPTPFSEPESIAVRDAILHAGYEFKVFLSFHSYFQLIIFPWGHKAEPCSAYLKLLEGGLEMARAIQSCYGLTYKVGCTKDLTYCACGTSIDWSFAVPKIPYSYMIELRSRKHKFRLPREQILPNCVEVWTGVQRLMEYVDANDLDLNNLLDPRAATVG